MSQLAPSTEIPYYRTLNGRAYWCDSLDFMRTMSDGSVNLVMTSPPFALTRKKEYGNKDAADYIEWFVPFAKEIYRILADNGSFVLDIGGAWNPGFPTRSLYQYQLLIRLCEMFHLAQDFFWYNPAKLPTPAEWVTVRRERVKDAVDCVWWLSKQEHPKANNRNVLQPYSESMRQLLRNGYRPKRRPSGHDISTKFQRDNKGAIPSNLLQISHTESNSQYLRACRETGTKPHPARFPIALPTFFIELLTDAGDLVLDPFAGSCVTGEACEKLGRKWIAVEIVQDYLEASKFRFDRFYLRKGSPHTAQCSLFVREGTTKYVLAKNTEKSSPAT